MATLETSGLGGTLQGLLMAKDIQPGDQPSYELCKAIYEYHPLGKRLADRPISMAMGKPREISVPAGPEDLVTKAFNGTWKKLRCDHYIRNTMRLSRVYGISSCAMGCRDKNETGRTCTRQTCRYRGKAARA